MKMPIQINMSDGKVQAVSMWHPINNKWMLVSQIVGAEHKFYTNGVEVSAPLVRRRVHPTASGVGMRARFGNWLVRVGQWFIQHGGG